MKSSASRSHEMHAYLDGELSAKERAEFERNLRTDTALKAEICDLRKIKQEMLSHYQKVPVPQRPQKHSQKYTRYWAMAASIALSVGLGFFLSQEYAQPPVAPSNQFAMVTQAVPDKVILHIDSNQPQRTQAVLQQAQAMLASHTQTHRNVEVEIVANHEGIELFDQKNPSKTEILSMLAKHDNLKLVACQRALERHAQNGHPVALIDHVESDKAAIDVIVEKMQKGWGYKKF